jgi:fructokinase
MKRFDCTVVGDVFFDIPVRGFSSQFYSGGTSYCNIAKPLPGGSGNVAVGISNLGGKVAFVGKAGKDVFGKTYEKDLKAHKVFSRMFFDDSLPTGLVFVVIEEHQRSFIVSRGANDQLSRSDIEKIEDVIRDSRFIYSCGYSLVRNPQKTAILDALERGKKFGTRVVFDPGAYNLILSDRAFFWSIIDLCDVVSLNLDEAKALTEKTSRVDMVREIAERVPFVVLKCGEDGSLLFNEGKIVRTMGYRVKCVDSTGAGDAFTSAIVYGLSHKLALGLTCELANWYAAQVVRKTGARCFPSKLQTERFIDKHHSENINQDLGLVGQSSDTGQC